MRYAEFRDTVRSYLRRRPAGRTWRELQDALDLPYDRPCPTWVARLESEIGLTRAKGEGRAYVWRLSRRS